MLEPDKPSDLGLGDAVLLREEGHASAERGFPCAALFEGVRCYAAALAGWMGFQELNVRSYRELDPLRLDVGVLMIASLERRALPLDFPSSRRRVSSWAMIASRYFATMSQTPSGTNPGCNWPSGKPALLANEIAY